MFVDVSAELSNPVVPNPNISDGVKSVPRFGEKQIFINLLKHMLYKLGLQPRGLEFGMFIDIDWATELKSQQGISKKIYTNLYSYWIKVSRAIGDHGPSSNPLPKHIFLRAPRIYSCSFNSTTHTTYGAPTPILNRPRSDLAKSKSDLSLKCV